MFEITFDSSEPMEMQFRNGSGGAVNSVNGQTGDVLLGSGDIAYSDSATYPSGSVGAEVSDLKSDFNDVKTAIDLETFNASTNLIDNRGMAGKTPAEVYGFASGNYVVYIPLNWGDNTQPGSYTGYFVLNDGTTDKTNLNAILLTLCDKDKNALANDMTQAVFNTSFNVPKDAAFVKLTMYNWFSYTIVKFGLCYGTYTSYATTPESERIKNAEKEITKLKAQIATFETSSASLSGYTALNLLTYNSKQRNTARAYFEIDSNFAGVQFARGTNLPYASGYCWLTPTKLQIYKYESAQVKIADVDHGLTLTDFVELTIMSKEDGKAIFSVLTGGGYYYTSEVEFVGCADNLSINPINCTISNVKLSFTDSDKSSKIWMFGDSYLDLYPQYIHQLGYDGFAMDGYSGRNSSGAWPSLSYAIQNQPTPDMLVWAIGMNDADSDSINASWLSYAKRVENLCAENGIELVYTTIPNTPTRDNSYKNEYIRTSGFRYCDIAGAVEPLGSSSWYSGLLSGDNVHPNTNGSKVIALRVIADIPELLKV